MEGTDRQHEVRPAVGCAAGCAVASDSGPPDVGGRCGGYCRAAASRVPVPPPCWPTFGLTWGAGPLEQTAVLVMGSIGGSRCFGASPLCFLLGVVPAHQVLAFACALGADSPCIVLPGSASRKPILFQKNGHLDSAQAVCACLLPCFPAYSAHLRWVDGGGGSAPGRDQQQAVSRLGLDVHSLSFTELKHCFAVLYL